MYEFTNANFTLWSLLYSSDHGPLHSLAGSDMILWGPRWSVESVHSPSSWLTRDDRTCTHKPGDEDKDRSHTPTMPAPRHSCETHAPGQVGYLNGAKMHSCQQIVIIQITTALINSSPAYEFLLATHFSRKSDPSMPSVGRIRDFSCAWRLLSADLAHLFLPQDDSSGSLPPAGVSLHAPLHKCF